MMAYKETHSSLNPLFMLKHVEVSDGLLDDDSDSESVELGLWCKQGVNSLVQVISWRLSLLEEVLHCCKM